MDVETLKELIQLSKSFKPEAQEIVDTILLFSPEIKQLMEALFDGISNLKIRMVKTFEDAEFTRDQAILLANDSFQSVIKNLNKNNK